MKLIEIIGNEKYNFNIQNAITNYKNDFLINKLKKDNIYNKEMEVLLDLEHIENNILDLKTLFQKLHLKDNTIDFYEAFTVILLNARFGDSKLSGLHTLKRSCNILDSRDKSYLYAIRYLPLKNIDFFKEINEELKNNIDPDFSFMGLPSLDKEVILSIINKLENFNYKDKIIAESNEFKTLFEEIIEVENKHLR